MTRAPQNMICRFQSRHHFNDDIFAIELARDDSAPFDYIAGQYAILSIAEDDEHAPRPYSIAGMPGQDSITFHIKNAGHGLSHALSTLKQGARINIEFPLGSAVYKSSDMPIIAIGGGLGLAPLLPIIQSALNDDPNHEIHIYHGVSGADDLYQDQFLKTLMADHNNVHYTGVIEDLHGTAAMAAYNQHTDLSGYIAYLSGAPAMVTATFKALEDRGLQLNNIISDALSDQIKDFV